MRVTMFVLSLAAACALAAAGPAAPVALSRALSAAGHAAPVAHSRAPAPASAPAAAPPAPEPRGARPLEGGEPAHAPADDLKPEATFWGGWGYGYRPRYYYRPYVRSYYSAPYWSGYSSYGWNSYW